MKHLLTVAFATVVTNVVVVCGAVEPISPDQFKGFKLIDVEYYHSDKKVVHEVNYTFDMGTEDNPYTVTFPFSLTTHPDEEGYYLVPTMVKTMVKWKDPNDKNVSRFDRSILHRKFRSVFDSKLYQTKMSYGQDASTACPRFDISFGTNFVVYVEDKSTKIVKSAPFSFD
jgi:hypothetical protein